MNILDVKINSLTWPKALEQTKLFLNDNQQHIIATINPEMVVSAQKDPEFKEVLNQADLSLPDGFGVILASWFLGNKLKSRITGVDFSWKLAELAENSGYSICLVGGEKNSGPKAVKVLKKKFPRLTVFTSGNNLKLNDPIIIKEINEFKPNILLVAFGFGRQEKWIANNLDKLPSADIAIGVGGTFDFISGRVRRAPKLMRRLGLEWLWRLVYQPWRWKRILTATCKFSYLVVKWRLYGDQTKN